MTQNKQYPIKIALPCSDYLAETDQQGTMTLQLADTAANALRNALNELRSLSEHF